jgi:hypothetical protein
MEVKQGVVVATILFYMWVPWLQATKQDDTVFQGLKMMMVVGMLLTLLVSVDGLWAGCPIWLAWKVQFVL